MYIHVNGILKKCLRTIIILVVPLMNIYRDLLWFNKTKHQMRNIVLIQFVLCLYYEKLYNRVTSTVLTVSYFDHASKINTVVWQKQNLRVLTEDVLLLPSNSEWNMNVQGYNVVDTWPAWGEPLFLGPFWEPGLPCSSNTFHSVSYTHLTLPTICSV